MGEIEVPLKLRHVDEGRFILARSEPEYEYDLDVDGHNELWPLRAVAESTLRNFDHLLTSSTRRKGGWQCMWCTRCVAVWTFTRRA
jgi:hypothetical protein